MNDVITYYLEMHSIDELNEKQESNGLSVIEAEIKNYRFNRYLYQLVGEPWQWSDKSSFSDDKWKAYAQRRELQTWVGYYKGSIAGYYELELGVPGDVEIVYFGLAPYFIGKGFGGYFLSCAIKTAWATSGVKRVWVHTSTLDHPAALQNYKARGFKLYQK